MAVGTISRATSQSRGSLALLVARTDRGYVNDTLVAQEEALTTPGVDGIRWRIVFYQVEKTELYTVIDCSTYADAINKKQIAEDMAAQLVNLSLDIDSVNYRFRQVHVDSVRAVAFPGPAVGAGATGTAHLVAIFILTPTDFT